MKTKNNKTEKAKSNKLNQAKPVNESIAQEEASKNPFSFGGIPQRDLKKNLGCG